MTDTRRIKPGDIVEGSHDTREYQPVYRVLRVSEPGVGGAYFCEVMFTYGISPEGKVGPCEPVMTGWVFSKFLEVTIPGD